MSWSLDLLQVKETKLHLSLLPLNIVLMILLTQMVLLGTGSLKKLYWTDVTGIEVIDLQTNYRMKVCSNPAMSNWRAIVLDPTTRCVYIQSFIKCLIEVNV